MEKIFATIIVFSLLIAISPVFAFISSSPNYRIQRDSINIGGTRSVSPNFRMETTIGEIATGPATSALYQLEAGYLVTGYAPRSQDWQWFDDEHNRTPISPLAAVNTAPANIENLNIIKLRLTIKETAIIRGVNIKMRLQYSTSSVFSIANDLVEIGSCTATSVWCYGDGVAMDNEPITTILLGDAVAAATHNESGISTTTYDHSANTAAEWEFTIVASGVSINTTYYFRAYDNTNARAVKINIGEAYPSLVTSGTTLTFTIAGLPSGTSTEGVVTDFGTTPTTIPFGVLSFNSKIEGAQRLAVSTNAISGYQIFVYERQQLLGAGGRTINPVISTNAFPASWATACNTVVSPGCFGYHTGDDTLAGGSVRFAVNDSYARFEADMKEIVYSSVPVAKEVTDFVFRVQITNQQKAGQYNNAIVYIVVPTF